jgi:quinol monooxygenase YgiN
MATILAHITIKAGAEARFEMIARELYAATHERESAVRRYEYWRGADPGTYYALLSFESFPDFIVHQTSDHHEKASPVLGEVIESLRLEWVDPIAGASPLVSTSPGALGPDTSERQRSYAARYAAEVAEWWHGLR